MEREKTLPGDINILNFYERDGEAERDTDRASEKVIDRKRDVDVNNL